MVDTIKRLIPISDGIGARDQAAIDPARVVSGHPIGTSFHQFTNQAGNFHVGTWSSDTGKWRIKYTEDEFCHILAGEAIITDSQGIEIRVSAGDSFVLPSGFEGYWETPESVTKIYVIYE